MSLFRLTPTPSGYLHIGNAFNFVLTWLIAREMGADILLRIDDMDAARRRDEYVEDMFRSIDALGLEYDLGPIGPDDFYAKWSQHHRMPLYEAALEKLVQQEDLIYACKLSRKEIKGLKQAGTYPEFARKQAVSLSEPETTWRVQTAGRVNFLDMNQAAYQVNIEEVMPDFVIRKKDGLPAYQLASLVDDQHFGVTGIVRGKDLVASTASQLWLAEKMGFEAFKEMRFLHHPLFVGADGEKLSKSAGAISLKEMLKKPEQIFGWISQAMNLPHCTSLEELQSVFNLPEISLSSVEILSEN